MIGIGQARTPVPGAPQSKETDMAEPKPAAPGTPVKLAPRAAAALFPLSAAGSAASAVLRR